MSLEFFSTFGQFGLVGITLAVMVYVIKLLMESQQKSQELLVKVNERTADVVAKNTEAINKFNEKLDFTIHNHWHQPQNNSQKPSRKRTSSQSSD